MSKRSVDRRKSRRAKQENRWAETKTPRSGGTEGQIEQSVLFVPDTDRKTGRRHDPHTTEVSTQPTEVSVPHTIEVNRREG